MTELLRPTDELESLIEKKEPRLPKGIRTYIRRLKQSGELDQALQVAQKYRQEKMRIYSVKHRLTVAVGSILTTEDPLQTVQEAVMVTWLLDRQGEITPEERIANLNELFKLNSDLEPELANTVGSIRDAAMRLSLN